MKRFFLIATILVFAAATAALGVRAAGAPIIVMAGQAKYGPAPAPYPSQTSIAVLSGDPTATGSQYAVRLKIPDGVKIAPHTHGDTENVTVISGTLMVGLGTTFDASHMLALAAGSYVSVPAGTPHFAMAKGDTVVQVNGVGPASMTLVH